MTEVKVVIADWEKIQYGDKVLMRVKEPCTMENAERIAEHMEQRFPGVEFTVLVADAEVLVQRGTVHDVEE